MILLALAQCGDLLVLDEPTDGLDPVVRRDILSALITYVSERGATIFISSHLVHELERVCDWIAVMDDGRLVTEAPMEKLKHGTKRLVVMGAPAEIVNPPFRVLTRESASGGGVGETWVAGDCEPGGPIEVPSRRRTCCGPCSRGERCIHCSRPHSAC